MLHRRTSLLWSALACVLSVSVAVPAVATDVVAPETSDTDTSDTDTSDTTTSDTEPGAEPEVGPRPVEDGVEHSSDETEPFLTARRAGSLPAFFNVDERTLPVAPGLEHTRYDRYDGRGWVRVHALTADLSVPGLRLDYTAPGRVSAPGPLSSAVDRDGSVAAVNGDFFDIGDTGAPLGVGVDRRRGLLHGSVRHEGWVNNTFLLDQDNLAQIAQTFLEARVVRLNGRPALPVTNLNAPEIRPGGIGIYTSAWGPTSRTRVLPSAAARREVVVRRGRVRANRKAVSSGPIGDRAFHLVGIGEGARKLSRLEVGQRVRVEYALNREASVAVGGNVVLLRDGEVLAPNDVEMHPRTAIGIDRDTNQIIVIAVDGRQGHSRGLTMKETGQLLKRMGAEDGLNLDGGGSSTMMARESGEPVTVVNSPSDGHLRAVPNGLGFSFADGSGRLRGFRIEPAWDLDGSQRVLRGLTRVLVARGHDETFDPVGGKPTWQGSRRVSARPGPALRTVVRGRRVGLGTVTATRGDAGGDFTVRVLGRVHRLQTSVPTISLSGKGRSATFDVDGYDANGFGTWVAPRDVRLSYDRDKLDVRRTGRGFRVTSRVASTNEVIEVTAGRRSTYVGVAVGLERRVRHRMNGLDGWTATAYPRRADAQLSLTRNRRGRPGKAIAMDYALIGKRATRAAYLNAKPALDLPARLQRVGLWVRGDGKGAWLRATVRDKSGSRATFTLARKVDWKGWRFVAAPVPAGLTQPAKLVRVYAVETNRKRRYRGTLAFDDLAVFTERVATVPATAPLRDPMVADVDPLEPGGLRVAVVGDAHIGPTAPNGPAANRARRTLREVVAASPDLVLVTGDLVASGDRTGTALARRILDEELTGRVEWRYVPGEGERSPGGDLSEFRSQFGDPVQVVDRSGTRFVLLNSAQGMFRLGGFEQLVRLRSVLATAADDASVSSVVVVAHHPTSDPSPGGTAALADPREGDLVEDLLARFRADSGKTTAYVAGHTHRFEATRIDGVQQVLAGPVMGAARSTLGAFTGWSLLRVAPEGVTVSFQPHVSRLRLTGPATLAVGGTGRATGTVAQFGRRVPVDYPMNVRWVGSRQVHVGAPSGAPDSAVVAVAPQTGQLTGLRAGTAEVSLTVNGVTASHTVTVG